ncbi:UTP--glucose-1-phosphate uridylyltransferase GalU [Desulforegula conservatrix]|uniref:UTP--glucose-1-phosphate uridylyltransferase GalU n=1 Tax=Desulforegula conservatrix TaxID=153026 RepID=UPI00041A1354|nr:UTP--glucose-1-phosphate uridylyltransferase GalU [Desulforegula conservatrix]
MKIKKAIFPVAGLGTRFLPATKAMPKEMLPVVDKPLIQYAVEEALSAGIEQIIFVTGRGKSALEDHFDHSFRLEQTLISKEKNDLLRQVQEIIPESGTIVYTRQNQPLGLGHAIWCARDIIGDEPFAVLLADDLIMSGKSVLGQMISKFERLRASVVAIEEVSKSETDKYGIIDGIDSGDNMVEIKGMIEKPKPENAPSNLAIIGRYILTPRIFELLEKQQKGAGGEIQLTDAMASLLDDQPIYGYKFSGKRFDCGSKAGFLKANIAFALENEEIKKELIPYLREISKENGV